MTNDAVLRNVRLHVRGTDHRIVIAPQARLTNLEIRMEGVAHELVIASHVSVHSGLVAFYDDYGSISIGERTTIYGASFGSTEGGRITVGKHCLISTEVDVRNGDSHSIVDEETSARLNPAADVTIGDHVWIGMRVMVLKGSRIAAHAVIGAGSIVNGEVAQGCVAVGSPARIIANGVTWRRERV